MAVKKSIPVILLSLGILLSVIIVVLISQNNPSTSQSISEPVQTATPSLDSDLIVNQQLSDYDIISNEKIMDPP